MNNGLFLVPGRNSRALQNIYYNTTKQVRVAEDDGAMYPVVVLQDMHYYLVHKNLVIQVDLKLMDDHWYIIPGFRIDYSHVNAWKYQDVRDLDNQPATNLVLDVFLQRSKVDNQYHVVEQKDYKGGQILIPAEEVWDTPHTIVLPNVVRNLTLTGQYDGKGSRSHKRAYDGFADILNKRGIRYTRGEVEQLIEKAIKLINYDEFHHDFNKRRLVNKRLPDMQLYRAGGCICGDSDDFSIRLQYGSKYHTDQIAKLLEI